MHAWAFPLAEISLPKKLHHHFWHGLTALAKEHPTYSVFDF
jgi:hypothetical protein